MPRLKLTIKERVLNGTALPPCQSLTIGKLDFRRYTQIPSRNSLPDVTYMGAIGEYSEADLAAFRSEVEHFLVRWNDVERAGKLVSAQVYDSRIKGFFPMPERDQPLKGYLEIQPVGAGDSPSVHVSTEEAVARLDAQASEDKARATDPTDERRRKVNARAKASGEPVES